MSFLYPYVLTALAMPLLLAGLALWRHRRAGKAWRGLVSPAHYKELVREAPAWRKILPPLLALLALTCTILAAARPINGYSETGACAAGRNIIIALDVSRSMETKDVAPSRLEQAKSAAIELIDSLPADKIGLIVFGGEADLIVPLTYDHDALAETIRQVDRTWMDYGGTNLANVLTLGVSTLQRSAPDGTNAIIILSDGGDTVDSTMGTIADKAKRNRLLVITVGVGTLTGEVIPDANDPNGIWRDANGNHVFSKLEPTTMSSLAEMTGGEFIVMDSGTDLAEFARHAVSGIDHHQEESVVNRIPNDLFAYFAVSALAMLVASILLATDWRLPRRTAPLLAFLLLAVTATDARAQEEESGELISDAGTLSPAEHYAAGLCHLKQGHGGPAKDELSLALLSDDPQLQAAAMTALGNIYTRATFSALRALYTPVAGVDETDVTADELRGIVAELRADLVYYQDALALDPTMEEARKNIEKIQKLIEALEAEIERLDNEDDDTPQDQQTPDTPGGQDSDDPQQGDGENNEDQPQDNQDQPQDNQDQQNDNQDQPQDDQNNPDGSPQPDQQPDSPEQQDQPQTPEPPPSADNGKPNPKPENSGQDASSENSPDNDKEKEKAEQRAFERLNMSLDEETGPPVPPDTRGSGPGSRPLKDY